MDIELQIGHLIFKQSQGNYITPPPLSLVFPYGPHTASVCWGYIQYTVSHDQICKQEQLIVLN